MKKRDIRKREMNQLEGKKNSFGVYLQTIIWRRMWERFLYSQVFL